MSKTRKVENTKGITVSVSPWTDEDDNGNILFRLQKLHVHEMAYGETPVGDMELIYNGSRENTNDIEEYIRAKETGTIEIEDTKKNMEKPGLTYKFNFFITSREYINNLLTLEFIILPGGQDSIEKGKNFYTAVGSETYEGIGEAIRAIYPGPILKKCETDIQGSDTIKIYRENETSSNLLCRLGASWVYKGIYAFGWEGLLLKEIEGTSSFGKAENDIKNLEKVIGDQEEWVQVSYNVLKYDKAHNYQLFDPWDDDNKDKDDLSKSVTPDARYKKEWRPKLVTSTIKADWEYRIHTKAYSQFQMNKDWNESFSGAGGYATVTLVGEDMPRQWKLGDVISYQRQSNDDKEDQPKRCIVVSNELFFSQSEASQLGPHGKPFEWTTILWGIDPGEWTQENEKNKNKK